MLQFRKRPVVIQAFQMLYASWPASGEIEPHWPDWFQDALKKPKGTEGSVFVHANGLYVIFTLEGLVEISHGDFVIRGVKGDLETCKPNDFAATYEPVEANPSDQEDLLMKNGHETFLTSNGWVFDADRHRYQWSKSPDTGFYDLEGAVSKQREESAPRNQFDVGQQKPPFQFEYDPGLVCSRAEYETLLAQTINDSAPTKSVVLIFSGGMDSATALYYYLSKGYQVRCLGVNYGQRHGKELEYARAMCENLGVEFQVAELGAIRPLLAGSSQTSDEIEVPEGHYAAENMKLTVVPNRNMIMLSIAIGWAISTKSDAVAYGAHSGDHDIYPDCRREFVEAMGIATLRCDWHHVELHTLFLDCSKAEIAKIGAGLGVPYEETWSCYKGGDLHCGKCGTCVERREAFELAGLTDPTRYEQEVK